MSRGRGRVLVDGEPALAALAAAVAQRWRTVDVPSLTAGLRGDLGAGKTTWVRAMLRGLGYSGRVPSPTYTLLEEYELTGLRLVHLDLYRLGGDRELDALGVRDWLGRSGVWVLAEWPERAPSYAAHCDLGLTIQIDAGQRRALELESGTPSGRAFLDSVCDLFSN